MKFEQIFSFLQEEGKIIKNVNTTVDVNLDSIKKEAIKFKNLVSKEGVPPTIDYENIKKSIIE